LSYVGVGVDPNTASFGIIINTARAELAASPVVWWTLLSAFVFMLMLVLSANLLADAIRDAFDPRARLRASLFRVTRRLGAQV
jgi:peptide/nickel transport system permease protein